MAQKNLNKINSLSKEELIQFINQNGLGEIEDVLVHEGITDGEKFLNLHEFQMIKWHLSHATRTKLLSFIKEVKQNPQKFFEIEKNAKPLLRRKSSVSNPFKEKLENLITSPYILPGQKEPSETLVVIKNEPPPTSSEQESVTLLRRMPIPVVKKEPLPTPVEREPETLPRRMPIPVIKKKPLPTPVEIEPTRRPFPVIKKKPFSTQVENNQDDEPLNEYLAMDLKPEVNLEDHYDPDGYLQPVSQTQEIEENAYEPSPSDRDITSFFSSLSKNNVLVSQRPPIALPRDSTDEEGYILGPEEEQILYENNKHLPPSLLPKVNRSISPRHIIHPPQKFEAKDETEEELVDYEPIFDDEDPHSENMSSELPNMDMTNVSSTDSGTISKIFSKWWKINKKPSTEPVGLEKEIKVNIISQSVKLERKTSFSGHLERDTSIRDRPLPELPTRNPTNILGSKQIPPQDYSSRIYENEKQTTQVLPVDENHTHLHLPKLLEKISHSKSDSHLDKQKDDPNVYGNFPNVDKPKIDNVQVKTVKYPENYEMPEFAPDRNRASRKKLPLPPSTLPQYDPSSLFSKDCDEEDQEYGVWTFNPNNEPYYRNTDRSGARELLRYLDDGAFLFRPSKKYFLTLCLKYDEQYFNLGIEKTDNNRIRLYSEGESLSPEFATIKEFINYFTADPLTFKHKGQSVSVYLRTLLPLDQF